MNLKAVLLILALLLFMGTATSWWNQSWEYRKPINVTEQSGNNLENYQLELTVDTATLISDGKMRIDCGDIRFVNSTDNGRLDYYIRSGCNTASTSIVVEIPKLESNSEKRIFLYYGNDSVSSKSSPYSTFIFFDDFNNSLSKWVTSGGISISNSHLKLDTADSSKTWQGAFSKQSFSDTNGDIKLEMYNVSHTYNYDDNNLNVGLVNTGVSPSENPDGADPKISIEHTESYSGSRAEFVCGSSDAPGLSPDYSNGDWQFIYRGGSAELNDGTETTSSSTVCNTDYQIMFSLEKESGADRISVGKVLVRRYTSNKPSVQIGKEERNEICDRRGEEKECIVGTEKKISNKDFLINNIFISEISSVIRSSAGLGKITVSNSSFISGLWTGYINFTAREIAVRPGASFRPQDRIILNEK